MHTMPVKSPAFRILERQVTRKNAPVHLSHEINKQCFRKKNIQSDANTLSGMIE